MKKTESSVDLNKKNDERNSILKFLLSIRTQVYFVLFITFLVLLVTILLIVLIVFPNMFYSFETINLTQNGQTINRIVRDIASELAQFTTQYIAAWDVSLAFFADYRAAPHPNNLTFYIEDNFPLEIFTYYNIDFVAAYYIDTKLPVYTRTYNYQTNTLDTIPFPDEIKTLPTNFNVTWTDSSTREMALISPSSSNETYITTFIPVQDIDGTGNVIAVYVVGRRLTERSILAEVAERSQVCTTFYSLNDKTSKRYLNVIDPINELKNNKGITPTFKENTWQNVDHVHTSILGPTNEINELSGRFCFSGISNSNRSEASLDSQQLSGFNIYNDINGNNAIIIRFDADREVQRLSYTSITIILIILCVSGLIIFILIGFLLEIIILSRVSILSGNILKVQLGSRSRVNQPNKINKNDEIGFLATRINNLLVTIEEKEAESKKFLNKLGKQDEKFRAILKFIPDIIIVAAMDTLKVLFVNKSFEITFMPSKDALDNNLTMLDLLIAKDKKELTDLIDKVESTPINAKGKFGAVIEMGLSLTTIELEDTINLMFILKRSDTSGLRNTKNLLMGIDDGEFKKFLNNEKEMERFILYCKKEQTEENVLCLMDIMKYKKSPTSERSQIQKEIYKKYLSDKPKFDVNVSSETMKLARESAINGLGESDLFSGLEKAMKFNIYNESYKRYLRDRNIFKIDNEIQDNKDKSLKKSFTGFNKLIKKTNTTKSFGISNEKGKNVKPNSKSFEIPLTNNKLEKSPSIVVKDNEDVELVEIDNEGLNEVRKQSSMMTIEGIEKLDSQIDLKNL